MVRTLVARRGRICRQNGCRSCHADDRITPPSSRPPRRPGRPPRPRSRSSGRSCWRTSGTARSPAEVLRRGSDHASAARRPRRAGSRRARWRSSPRARCASSTTRRSAGSRAGCPGARSGCCAARPSPRPTCGVALKRWFRHHRLVTDDIVLELVRVAGAGATVSIRRAPRPRRRCASSASLSYLRYVHGYACWAVDSRISLLEVGFPFPAPAARRASTRSSSRGRSPSSAERAHFAFDARYLALPQRRDDAALRAMLQHALPLTVLQYRRDRLLVQRVRRLLAEHPDERHDADAVARRLHLSTRSLHRHLATGGRVAAGAQGRGRGASAPSSSCAGRRGRSSRSRSPWASPTRRASRGRSRSGPATPRASTGGARHRPRPRPATRAAARARPGRAASRRAGRSRPRPPA